MRIIHHLNPILPKFGGRSPDSSSDEDSGNETDASCRKLIRHMESSPLNANRLPNVGMATSLLHTSDVFEKIQARDKPKAREQWVGFVEQVANSSSKYRSEPLNRKTRQHIKASWQLAKQDNPQGYKAALYDQVLRSEEGLEETEHAQKKVRMPLTYEQREALELKPSVRQALDDEARRTARQKPYRQDPFQQQSDPSHSTRRPGSKNSPTYIPVPMDYLEREKQYQKLEKQIKKSIIGQDRAINRLLNQVEDAYVLEPPEVNEKARKRHPRLVVLLAGPSGVGKTQTVELLKHFGNRKIIHLDGGEYSDDTHTNKIVGTGPGYSGNKSRTVVDDIVDACERAQQEGRQPPIILIDELDKASERFFTIWNAAFSEGRLSRRLNQESDKDTEKDQRGEPTTRNVDFTKIDIFCTSNFAQNDITQYLRNKTTVTDDDIDHIAELIKNDARNRKGVQADFWSRFTDVIPYENLSNDAVRTITHQIINNHKQAYTKEGLAFEVTQPVIEKVLEKGHFTEEGCHKLKTTLSRFIGQGRREPLRQFRRLQAAVGPQKAGSLQKEMVITLDSQSNIQGQLRDRSHANTRNRDASSSDEERLSRNN